MTEEKSKNELERMSKRTLVIGTIGCIPLFVGLVIFLVSLMGPSIVMYPDNEHITDQGTPLRDIKNATYTWTAEEIGDMREDQHNWGLIGLSIAGVGFVMSYSALLIMPSKKKLHEIGCVDGVNYHDDQKYCSGCGLKLEKKG